MVDSFRATPTAMHFRNSDAATGSSSEPQMGEISEYDQPLSHT